MPKTGIFCTPEVLTKRKSPNACLSLVWENDKILLIASGTIQITNEKTNIPQYSNKHYSKT